MKKQPKTTMKTPDLSSLSAAELRLMVAQYQAVVEEQNTSLLEQNARLENQKSKLNEAHRRIALLEEINRLLKTQKFSASSEKSKFQFNLFDETELEVAINTLLGALPETDDESTSIAQQRKERKSRQRGFSANLVRERIEHQLTELEKAGASKTFFTKVKEELHYIPAQLKVLEHWQEKAVFTPEGDAQEEQVVAAQRPVHPFGKCSVTTALIAHVIVDKYQYGMPLYRQESKFKGLGQPIYRNSMAQWCMRFGDTAKPLLQLMREVQNSSNYLQADETRLQALKEDGKTAQSDKWMWVTRGGHRISLVYFLNTTHHEQAVWLCACWMILKAYCKPMATLAIAKYAARTTSPVSAAGIMRGVNLLRPIKALILKLKPRKAQRVKPMWHSATFVNSTV